MDKSIKRRVITEANYIIDTKDTIRKAANKFQISKSTVHYDLTKRLKKIDENLAKQIDIIFKKHDEVKHIRGGYATKEKYKRGNSDASKQSSISD